MGQKISGSNGAYPDEYVIFSFNDGYVWASWPDTVAKVRIGSHDAVIAAMVDYMAQSELAERLANGVRPSTTARSL